MTQVDTFYFLAETPDQRDLGLLDTKITYKSKHFNPLIYSSERNKSFASLEEAYRDWIELGRRQGIQYGRGRDTTLKIILKTKDEPELLEKWITHHATIVGFDNIIIMDCGSSNPIHLEILERYKTEILIFDYRKYYDHLHTTWSNKSLFKCLSLNCKYVTILDTDEFLFTKDGDEFTTSSIGEKLRQSEVGIFAATWIENTVYVGNEEGTVDWSRAIEVACSKEAIDAGTVAGKSIVRSDLTFDIKHVGHNLHVKEVARMISHKSFDEFYILHLETLHPKISRPRILKHLVAKGVISTNFSDNGKSSELLKELLASADISSAVRGYINKYLAFERTPKNAEYHKEANMVRLLDGVTQRQELPALRQTLNEFDFRGLLDTYQKKLSRA